MFVAIYFPSASTLLIGACLDTDLYKFAVFYAVCYIGNPAANVFGSYELVQAHMSPKSPKSNLYFAKSCLWLLWKKL